MKEVKTRIKINKIISEKKNWSIIYIIVAFCLPILLYLQTVDFGFTYFDDDGIILNNITFLGNFRNVLQAFLTDQFIDKSTLFYRPLGTLSYMVDIQLSGGASNPWMFHFSNILLLGSIACLLFLLLKQFLIPTKLALFGTLVYCAHPLFVSTIALIPNRAELLLVFFSLLSFLFFIEFIQKGTIKYLFLNWVSFTLALFSKETAAFLPFLFIIYFFLFSFKKHIEKKYFFNIMLYAISGIFWFYLRFKAIGNISNYTNDVFGFIPLLSNIRVIPESLTKFFLLIDIIPIPFFSFFKTFAGLGIIILIIIIVLKSWKRSKKEKIFCFIWFFILMFPSMLYKNPTLDYLDHRFFFPLIGILLFLLLIFPKKWTKNGDIKISWLLIAGFIFLCSFTFIKTHPYQDQMTFYNSAISQNSNSAFGYNNRGKLKIMNSDFQGAIEDFKRAIAICPIWPVCYYNIGVAKESMNDNFGAIEYYKKAIAINPNYIQAFYNIGVLKAQMGDNHEALDYFNKTIAINSNYVPAYFNRGVVKENLSDIHGAIDDFNKAISIRNDYAEAYSNKGGALNSISNFQEAIISLNKAIEINPKLFEAYENRAYAKYNLNDLTGAVEDCEMALNINPNDEIVINFKAKLQQELQKINN